MVSVTFVKSYFYNKMETIVKYFVILIFNLEMKLLGVDKCSIS